MQIAAPLSALAQLLWDLNITWIRLVKDFSQAKDSTGMHGTWVPHTGAALHYWWWCAREEASGGYWPRYPTRPLPFVLSSPSPSRVLLKKGSTKKAKESACTKEVDAPSPSYFNLKISLNFLTAHWARWLKRHYNKLRSLQCSGGKLKCEVQCILHSQKVCLIVLQNVI